MINLKSIVGVALVLTMGVIGGGYFGCRAYVTARQAHQLKQAEKYLAKPDFINALLSLQGVLKSNPRNLEACRLMAAMCETTRSPEALLWRAKVVEFNPGSLADQLTLAQTAMMFSDQAAATGALEAVDAAGRQTTAFQNVAGEVASMAGQLAQAEAHFQEAVRLGPTNPVARLNLAVVRLQGTNTAAKAEARNTLTQLSSAGSGLRCQALRELVLDALRSRQTNAAAALARELVQLTNAAFSDQLLRLDVLKAMQNPGFKTALSETQRCAETNTARIYELAVWQLTGTSPGDALTWLRSLPQGTQTNQTVAFITAECLTTLGNWRGLLNTVTNQNWDTLDFVRHAFMARALREQDFNGASLAEWQVALQTAEGQKAALIMLVRMAAAWKWADEGEKLLITIVNRYPSEKWAAEALTKILYARGKTPALLQLFIVESRRAPDNLDLKNNLALAALLVGNREVNPHEVALEVYLSAPTNVAYANTYAFSLYLQKKFPDALKILQTFKPQEHEQPANAGYYGLILQAAGKPEQGRPYLDLALKSFLLPEERDLFKNARAGF